MKRSPRLYLTYYTTEHWGDCKSMHKIVIGDRGTTATERDRGCCTLIFSKCQASHHSWMAVAHYGLRFVSRWLANNRRRLPPSVGRSVIPRRWYCTDQFLLHLCGNFTSRHAPMLTPWKWTSVLLKSNEKSQTIVSHLFNGILLLQTVLWLIANSNYHKQCSPWLGWYWSA